MEPNIQSLIELYFEGKTTIDEEQELRTYFTKPNINQEWKHLQPMFAGFHSLSNETSTRPINTSQTSSFNYWWAAAGLAIVVLLAIILTKQSVSYTEQDAFESFDEFRENVMMISTHLNSGTTQLAYLETFDQTTTKYLKTE